MKKVFTMIISMMVLVLMLGGAHATEIEAIEKAIEDLELYIKENDLENLYNEDIDEFNVYGEWSVVPIDNFEETFDMHEDWNSLETWFVEWYHDKIEETRPEYGKVHVMMRKNGNKNGTDIYHITVIGENDLVDWIEGDQHVVDMLVAFV